MQLDQEILGLEERKKVLSEVCKIYNEEFVTFAKAAGEQTYVTNRTFTYKRIEGERESDRKRKCEEHELEIKKHDEVLVALHKKRKEVNSK